MSVLAVVVPPLGVLLGVLVGALVEPLKLRFAAGARRRQLRDERCADVVCTARDVRDGLREFVTVFEIKQSQQIIVPPGMTDRGREIMNETRKSGSALRSAAALVELGGPDELADSARAIRRVISRLLLDVPTKRDEFDAILDELDNYIDAFVLVARKHVG